MQLRHKGHFDRETYAKAQQIAILCEQADVLLVINDRVDVAMLLNAAVHVGQDDLPPSHARETGRQLHGFLGSQRITKSNSRLPQASRSTMSPSARSSVRYPSKTPIRRSASRN